MKDSYHIILGQDGRFRAARVIEHNGNYDSEILFECATLIEAENFLIEDGVPGNSIGGGNIAATNGEEPPAQTYMSYSKKRKKRRFMFGRLEPVSNINDVGGGE